MSGLLWLCFALSGATALALEVLWLRSTGLVLGMNNPSGDNFVGALDDVQVWGSIVGP